MKELDIQDLITSAWCEKVYIETTEHIIHGYVFMPKIGKQNRMLTDILNTGKNFIAVKDCEIEYKNFPQKEVESHKFIQLNLSNILIMRPDEE